MILLTSSSSFRYIDVIGWLCFILEPSSFSSNYRFCMLYKMVLILYHLCLTFMNRFEKAAKETECVIDNNLVTSISLSSHSLWNWRIFFLKKMIRIAKYICIYICKSLLCQWKHISSLLYFTKTNVSP